MSGRRGAAAIRYEGPRGVVWRIKWRDTSGRQVMETLGSEDEGWTRERAWTRLEERLVEVGATGLTKRELLPRTGYVYFVAPTGGGPVKIGWTRDVERRLASLRTGSPVALEPPGRVRR